MKLILVMVMLATALTTSGCASRRAAAREAKAAKLAQTAPPVAAVKSATPAAAPATDAAVNTYAVSAMPASAKSTAVAVQTPVMVAPARPASVATGVAVTQHSETGSKAVETSFTPPLENIEKVPFQIGTSSVTVERLAQAAGCAGGKGAGLVTEKGPIEVYRMQCDNGKVFLAKCELRQCSPMRW